MAWTPSADGTAHLTTAGASQRLPDLGHGGLCVEMSFFRVNPTEHSSKTSHKVEFKSMFLKLQTTGNALLRAAGPPGLTGKFLFTFLLATALYSAPI